MLRLAPWNRLASGAGQKARLFCRTLPFVPPSPILYPDGPPPASRRFNSNALFRFSSETIYALSTAQGRAGIAIVRVSGPACLDVYRGLCPSAPPPKPRHATVRKLVDPSLSQNTLDPTALVLYFPGPRTVTGEDVLELHIHGGLATVRAVLSAIPASTSGTAAPRPAEPGEFTRRAFLHGRVDLAQVEALGDALAAETEQQRRAAVRGSAGQRGRTYEVWRAQLVGARGELEALIDFAEDQSFDETPGQLMGGVAAAVREMLASIAQHQEAGRRSELLRNGIRIALLGPVNVGKSSLMNAVVGREASIVSREAGTTRDVVEVNLDIQGYLCLFADTAGIRTDSAGGQNGVGEVEMEGIRRAKIKAAEADVVVVLASVEKTRGGDAYINYDDETLQLAAAAQACLIVVNKRDAVDDKALAILVKDFQRTLSHKIPDLAKAANALVVISCQEAHQSTSTHPDAGGIRTFTNQLVQQFTHITAIDQEELLGVTARQRQLLIECRHFLEAFMAEVRSEHQTGRDADVVLAAEYLRFAADCLSRITGRGGAGDVEEVLGVVFERFCVGK